MDHQSAVVIPQTDWPVHQPRWMPKCTAQHSIMVKFNILHGEICIIILCTRLCWSSMETPLTSALGWILGSSISNREARLCGASWITSCNYEGDQLVLEELYIIRLHVLWVCTCSFILILMNGILTCNCKCYMIKRNLLTSRGRKVGLVCSSLALSLSLENSSSESGANRLG